MPLGGRYRDGWQVSPPVLIALIAIRVTLTSELPTF